MSKSSCSVLIFILFASICVVGQESATKPKSTKQETTSVAQKLQKLQDQLQQQMQLIQQQQAQINQLQQQLLQSNSQLEQKLREAEQKLQAPVQQASEQAAAAQQSASALNATVNDLKSNTSAVAQDLKETQKTVKNLENPVALRYKGLTLTPGGFITADVFRRSRNENADVSSNFGASPFGGTANAHLSEFRASSRGSRISLLGEGKVGNTKLTGYYEIDFLAQAPTGNQVETNSFSPRQRQLFAQVDFSNGFTFTGGQFWSLITTDRKGIATRAEFIPGTLEAGYVIGYNYVRQTAFRVTKNFNNKIWAAFEVANPETTFSASYIPGGTNAAGQATNIFGLNISTNAASPNGSTLNYLSGSTNGFSTNLAPDLLAKVTFEPGWGHYEIKAVGRSFRDRTDGTNLTGAAALPTRTNVSFGGGLGFAAILPVVAKKADFILEGLGGSGIGRYGTGLGPDVTIRPDGVLVPIHAWHFMGGFEIHPQPKLDLFTYGGGEYYGRAAYVNPVTSGAAGYGSPLVNNTNCQLEIIPTGGAACGAQNKSISEGTAGFWYRFYKGPFGTLQYGAQYEYLYRDTWSGTGGTPKGMEHVVLTSVRFILP